MLEGWLKKVIDRLQSDQIDSQKADQIQICNFQYLWEIIAWR